MKSPSIKITSSSIRRFFGINKVTWGLLSAVITIIVLIFYSQPGSPTGNQESGISGEEAAVVDRVVDGDTIEIVSGGQKLKLRYIGVNTPETVKPNSPVECYGKEASAFNKQLTENKTVYLEKDVSDTDSFGRLLRYVYLKDRLGNKVMVNETLVREGYAYASTFPPDVRYSERFRNLESEAREAKRGLWEGCPAR